jgi:DNA-binding FadR family transcriptional regulator
MRTLTANRRLHGSVAHKLALLIISGRLQPGETLPNEDELSVALSVSRTAYREGVRTLVAKGLVETRPKTGTKVCARSQWSMLDPDVLAWNLESEPSYEFIVSLFEIRQIVEPSAAALAALRRDDLDIGTMTNALASLENVRMGSAEGLEADLAFHRALLKATRNEPLFAISSAVESTMRWSVRLTLTAFPGAHHDSLPDHKAVLAAIVAKDAAAAQATMARLVEQALANTLQSLKAVKR